MKKIENLNAISGGRFKCTICGYKTSGFLGLSMSYGVINGHILHKHGWAAFNNNDKYRQWCW